MVSLFDKTARVAGVSAAAGAASAFLAAGALVYASARRHRAGRRELEERLAAAAGLAAELEIARAEARRSRQLSRLASTIDLDSVLSHALEDAAALPLVDAAMVVVSEGDGAPVVATVGLSAEEAARQETLVLRRRDARTISIAYGYPDAGADEGEPIRGGLVLPLHRNSGDVIGTLSVFWRADGREPTEAEAAELEELAETAGGALDNACRFREARKLADLDALTSLHNRRYFHETLAREVARAARYDRRLALVVFDLDDFKAINDRVGHLAGDAVLAELADRMRSVVRNADIACRVGGDEFAVILPESTRADAEQLYRRLEQAASIGTRRAPTPTRLHLSAGIAELAPGDDAVSFFERADEALFRAKEAGKGHAVAADGS